MNSRLDQEKICLKHTLGVSGSTKSEGKACLHGSAC